MKKVIITIVAFVALATTSCKKDYTCKCTKIRTGNSTTVTSEDGTYAFKDTRKRAEDRCNDQESTGSDIFGDYTRECQIQ